MSSCMFDHLLGCEIIFDSSDAVGTADNPKPKVNADIAERVNIGDLKDMLGQLCNDVSKLEVS